MYPSCASSSIYIIIPCNKLFGKSALVNYFVLHNNYRYTSIPYYVDNLYIRVDSILQDPLISMPSYYWEPSLSLVYVSKGWVVYFSSKSLGITKEYSRRRNISP